MSNHTSVGSASGRRRSMSGSKPVRKERPWLSLGGFDYFAAAKQEEADYPSPVDDRSLASERGQQVPIHDLDLAANDRRIARVYM